MKRQPPTSRMVSGQMVRVIAALALAQAAETQADELHRQSPLDTALNGYWLPSIRGECAVEHHNPAQAIALLQAATAHELGVPTLYWTLNITAYPIYVRGRAYLASGKGTEAAAEFQKVLDHFGLVGNSPIGALARLGLARAYALQAHQETSVQSEESARARAAYQAFFVLWKDADPDTPILKAAKTEYARLR